MDYRVDHGELARAARNARGIAEGSSSATSRMRLDLVSAAIPGSISAGRAQSVDDKLVEAALRIEADLTNYAGALAVTAENYRVVEDAAEDAVKQFFGGTT